MPDEMNYPDWPALAPPPGVLSNFNDPKTLSTSLLTDNAIFLSLMLIVVGIRLYSRAFLSHAVGWDDYMCLLAALCSAAHSFMTLWIIQYGFGRHLWDIRAITLLPSRLKQMGSMGIIGSASTLSIKISIFLFYLRLFRVNQRFRYWVHSGMLFCILYTATYSAFQTASIIECSTPQSLDIAICANSDITTVIVTVINVVADFYVLALPIGIVGRLNVKRTKKLGLIAVFLCGLIASLANVAKLIYATLHLHDQDSLWSAALTTEFAIVEMNLGIIAASMPALPQFFAKARIFHASTYSFLHRLLNRRDPSSLSWFGQSSKSLASGYPERQRGPAVRGESETEVQSLPDIRAYTRIDVSHDDIDLGGGLAQT